MRIGFWRGIILTAVALAAGVTWYACQSRRAATTPRAVFLIIIDTLRADRLSCYGFAGHHTTNADSLASRGVLFENVLSNASWTVPSMGTIMTSRYPGQLGLIEAAAAPGQRFRWRDRREQIAYTITLSTTTLAEVFRDHGYRTAGFVNQPALNNYDGFLQGYDDWFYPAGEDTIIQRDPAEPLKDNEKTRPRVTQWKRVDQTDLALTDAFVEWLGEQSRENMFVWIQLLSPHKPYNPPEKYAPRVQKLPDGGQRATPPDVLYNGEVKYADDLVGEILRAIDRHVGFENSLIVFTSDHGEEFGEHKMEEHGHSLHREVVHVPLIITGPDLPAGRRVEPYVRLIDLYPTILSLSGLGDATPSDAEGADVSPLVDGKKRKLIVYSEGMLYGSSQRSLLSGDFRLMWHEQSGRYRLYRISADPGETIDVSTRFEAETTRMRNALVNMNERLRSDYLETLRTRTAADSLTAAEERERVLKAMKSLGYVNE
jgi:arylsulfatase A-like enzyme